MQSNRDAAIKNIVRLLMSRSMQNGMDDRAAIIPVDPKQMVPSMDHQMFMTPTWERYQQGIGPKRRMPSIQKPGIDG